MSKLFITPQHGYLGKTIDELREENYTVKLIGYGYPPIFVEADTSLHDTIKQSVGDIDEKAEFRLYGPDLAHLIDVSELLDILKEFSMAEIRELCLKVNVNHEALSGYVTDISSNLSLMRTDLVGRFKDDNERLTKLINAVYEVRPTLF